jgi:hypothetical protein
VEDWLYEDGEDETKGVYVAKLEELKKVRSFAYKQSLLLTYVNPQSFRTKKGSDRQRIPIAFTLCACFSAQIFSGWVHFHVGVNPLTT